MKGFYNKIYCAICLVFVTIFMAACDKDESVYPSVITNYVEAFTDPNGIMNRICTDDGQAYMLKNALSGNMAKDSVYRVYCSYAISEENPLEVNVYSLKRITSPDPVIRARFKEVKTDAVSGLQSIWRSGNYINLVIKVMVHGDIIHTYHFIDDGIIAASDNSDGQTLNIMLYHNRFNDTEGWTNDVYLSIPLTQYNNILKSGDHIRFSMNTYDGVRSWIVDY